MANTRASNKAAAQPDDSKGTDTSVKDEQKDTTTNDGGDQNVSNDDVKATGDADQADNASDDKGGDTDEQAEKDERNSDLLGNTLEDIDAAVEENPDAPEEAIETHYLVGGEVPVGAPGTEGLDRE